MAGIDKIYGTNNQYDDLKSFLRKYHVYALRYMYPREGWDDDNCRPISNFPKKVDMWLLRYQRKHKLQWVVDRIKEQYGMQR